jgi:hypothetical protein
MRVTSKLGVVLLALSAIGCGDDYEGGGRRDKVPSEETSQGPGVGLGDGMSTQGGTSGVAGMAAQGGAGDGGTSPFPFPIGGTTGGGGTAGTGGE